MRTLRWLVFISVNLCFILAITAVAAQEKLALTLESIFASDEFRNQSLQNIQWAADSSAFTFTRRNAKTGLADIYQYQAKSGERQLLLAADKLKVQGLALAISQYQYSPDGKYLLLRGKPSLTWDNVQEAPYYVYEIASEQLRVLAEGAALRNTKLSPDGRFVGYVLDNNLYLSDLQSQSTRAITKDGSANIFNGIFDYGSTEFGFLDAWHWSPDSQKIAFWRLDVSAVKTFDIIDELGSYSKARPLKYPNAGERHAINQIGVYDLTKRRTRWMDIGDNPDDYIPQISWTPAADQLLIQRLTRDHERLDLLLANTATGKSKLVVTETDPAWIDITDDLRWLHQQDRFVWTSEKSGYRHAYLYDYAGNQIAQLTQGDWEISELIELDENTGWLYFYAKKDTFIDQHVYRVNLKGSVVEKLSDQPGWYHWQLSPNGQYVIQTYSNARTPPSQSLHRPDGKKIRVLAASQLDAMAKYAMPHTEFFKVKTSDGILIDAFMIKPLDFDPNKKYPVIGYGYGNAGSQVVVNRWGTQRGPTQDLWHRYMAQQGYIIFAIDNRTTAGRGKAAKNLTYGHYGKYAILDYLEGVKHLKSLPYIDASRLGFWGWSGGGYLAAALMTKGAPHFKTAVSVAPVIDLSRYQAVGVERWMDFIEDNPRGYYETNLINYADKLEGNLLLIHGTGDENVKFAFTLQFADALIKQNKQFDMMVYPNQHHGIQDAQLHVFTKIRDYFLKNL